MRNREHKSLKQHHRRCKESHFIDPDFAEALRGGESQHLKSNWQAQRKVRQFCRQVQRAINLALADGSANGELNGLYVEEVSAAPDCGHLLVHVAIPDGRTAADAMAALRLDAPRLRAEVAMAITRKRAPELFFVPAFPDGGADE